MPISTGALTIPRIAAFRGAGEAADFLTRFTELGFSCSLECSQASCGFWLVHYAYYGLRPIDCLDHAGF